MAVIKLANSKKINNNQGNEIARLQKLLAIEIQRSSESLKENIALQKKLEQVEKQRDSLLRNYKKSKKKKMIRCDRSKAMVEYSDIDLNDV